MRVLAHENFPDAAVAALEAADVGQRFASLVTARDDWAGHFSVIEPGRIRMRPLR